MFKKNEQRKLTYRMLVFAEVVRSGSFTTAAERLGHTRSAVSTYINQLESLLGVRLLNRNTRNLNVTAAGHRFVEHCYAISDIAQLAVQEVRALADEPSGNLGITAPHAFAAQVIEPVIRNLRKQYPEVVPHLLFSDDRLDLIENKLDLAVRVGELPDSNYHAIKIGLLESVLVASPQLLCHQDITSIDDLRLLKKVVSPWQPVFKLLNTASNEILTLTLEPKIPVNTLLGTLAMVSMGFGVALVPKIFAQSMLDSGELVQVLVDWRGEQSPVYAVHPYQNQRPLALSYLIDELRQRLASLGA